MWDRPQHRFFAWVRGGLTENLDKPTFAKHHRYNDRSQVDKAAQRVKRLENFGLSPDALEVVLAVI